jgi:transposase InsO family protein
MKRRVTTSRSSRGNSSRRRNSTTINSCATEEKDTAAKKKGFKEYASGFIHIDIKYLPKMPDETSRRYLFVAIDRASRSVFQHIYEDQSEEISLDFHKRLQAACPIHIRTILTDNGAQFTDRFTSRRPSGTHAFDQTSARIDHLILPRHPQTNGMVERMNGRISELLPRHASGAQPNLSRP